MTSKLLVLILSIYNLKTDPELHFKIIKFDLMFYYLGMEVMRENKIITITQIVHIN